MGVGSPDRLGDPPGTSYNNPYQAGGVVTDDDEGAACHTRRSATVTKNVYRVRGGDA
jgi:hypothetical protein